MNLSDLSKQVRVLVDRMPATIRTIVEQASDAAMHRMHRHFTPWQGDGSWRSRMQGMLFRRGGTLEDSLRLAISERPNEISALFSMASPGATTQEFGAISAPTRAQALTIPVGEQLHASGRRRYRSVAESRQDFSLFRHGDTLMGHQHGAPSFDTKVQWLLRRHVTVPARPVIGPEVVVAAETVANQCAGRIADLLAGDF